jgi:Zn-dependent protease
MLPTRQGSIHLFRFAGIDVFLHWSWFLVAAYEISSRAGGYSSLAWNALEYVALFLIVLMHEFGHALACRQVGGQANQIVLWPLGGVAYVAPPPRPGATLWSLAAGPLVNVVLAPILTVLFLSSQSWGWEASMPNAYKWINTVWLINLLLLIFNLLPIYPLDGGQILRCLLWFGLGRARSLLVATFIGFGGVAVLAGFAFWMQSVWLGVLCVFILANCWRGWTHARALSRTARAPRREGFACPACQAAPPVGAFWVCSQCRQPFDTFQNFATCPHCGAQYGATMCQECGTMSPMNRWVVGGPVDAPFASFPPTPPPLG